MLAAEVLAALRGTLSLDRIKSLHKFLHFLHLERFDARSQEIAPDVAYTPQCRTLRWLRPGEGDLQAVRTTNACESSREQP